MELADFEKMEQIRARVDDIVEDRRPPRPSSPGTASSASGPASTTSTCRPSTGPTSPWSTPTAGASTASPSAAWWSGTRIRARLPHLRHRLRGGHRLHPPRRLRRGGTRRHHALGVLGRLNAVAARHARPRLSQHVRPGPHPRRLHRQLPPPARRGQQPHIPHRRPRHRRRRPRGRGHRRGRGEVAGALAEPARDVRSFQEQCTPGYYNNEGRPADGGFLGSSYGRGPSPSSSSWRTGERTGCSKVSSCVPDQSSARPMANSVSKRRAVAEGDGGHGRDFLRSLPASARPDCDPSAAELPLDGLAEYG